MYIITNDNSLIECHEEMFKKDGDNFYKIYKPTGVAGNLAGYLCEGVHKLGDDILPFDLMVNKNNINYILSS